MKRPAEEKVGGGSERRIRPRHPYGVVQFIAVYDGENVPPPEQFRTIHCHDLSTGGFSYYADRLPSENLLVAALGTPSHFHYLVAQVRYAKRISSRGKGMFLVGCKFVERIAELDPQLIKIGQAVN